MRIAVVGSGGVGRTVAAGLAAIGNDVVLGTRDTSVEELVQWAREARVRLATPAEAVEHGELVVNATPGRASERALADAGLGAAGATILLDLANPLEGLFPPSLFVSNTDSLAERLQRALPDVRVVKALNTVNAEIMVDPGRLAEPSALFLAGDSAVAKETVARLLGSLGWGRDQVIDLGGIEAARGAEAYLLLWVSVMGALGTARFNVRIVREPAG